MATTQGCDTRRSTEIAKNSSIISFVRPIAFAPYCISISDSITVGPIKTPISRFPNAFINALSSNSPTTRGRSLFFSNHRSRGDLTATSTVGTSIGAPFRQAGNFPLRLLRIRPTAKKLIPDSPSRWLYARTLTECGIGEPAITRSNRWAASSARRFSSVDSWHTMRTGSGRRVAGSIRLLALMLI